MDGAIWVAIAVFGTAQGFFGSDEAAKYIKAEYLFWVKGFCLFQFTGWSALKMFRSTAFADHLKKVNGGDTTFFGNPKTELTSLPREITKQP